MVEVRVRRSESSGRAYNAALLFQFQHTFSMVHILRQLNTSEQKIYSRFENTIFEIFIMIEVRECRSEQIISKR